MPPERAEKATTSCPDMEINNILFPFIVSNHIDANWSKGSLFMQEVANLAHFRAYVFR